MATAEDLGTQGEPPSHPELLDWLAVELMDHNWSLKHIHRLIVTSATYRQSSDVTPELLARDPDNRLLARGPRYPRRRRGRPRHRARGQRAVESTSRRAERLSAGAGVPVPAAGQLRAEDVDRTTRARTAIAAALYTFRFRSVPYPALQNFDAPNGEVACARRVASNTPLQALDDAQRAAVRRMCAGAGAEDC